MTAADKIAIYRKFIKEIEDIGVELLHTGDDTGDPLELARLSCDILEESLEATSSDRN